MGRDQTVQLVATITGSKMLSGHPEHSLPGGLGWSHSVDEMSWSPPSAHISTSHSAMVVASLSSERARNLQLFHTVSFRRGARLLTAFWKDKTKKDKCQTKWERIPAFHIATHISPANTIWVGIYKNQRSSHASPPASHESSYK